MREPAVTLTDYALALECGVLAVLLMLTPTSRRRERIAGIGLFLFFAISAAIGGSIHGFCADKQSPGCSFFWKLTLASVGWASFSTWTLGASLVAADHKARWLGPAGVPQILVYLACVFFVTREFWLAFTIYLPATLLLLAGFLRSFGRGGGRWLLVGALGPVTSLVSCFLQFMKIGIDPVLFDHNALAHVVQAVAMGLTYRGIRAVLAAAP